VPPTGKTDVTGKLFEIEERLGALERLVRPAVSRIEPDALYLVTEVAALMGCSKTNVYELLLAGDLAKTSIGVGTKGLRVRGSDVLSFLDSRREGGPRPQGTFKYLKVRP
jgi:hypothetical protein